jgi:hypothetical protein
MNISIKTIPQKEQRYKTVGDYWYDEEGNLQIRVSNLNNWVFEAIVYVHELVEALLCKYRGITINEIDDFDMSPYGLSLEEPGLDPKAPYFEQHAIALQVEELLYEPLGVYVDEFEDRMGEVIDT